MMCEKDAFQQWKRTGVLESSKAGNRVVFKLLPCFRVANHYTMFSCGCSRWFCLLPETDSS